MLGSYKCSEYKINYDRGVEMKRHDHVKKFPGREGFVPERRAMKRNLNERRCSGELRGTCSSQKDADSQGLGAGTGSDVP